MQIEGTQLYNTQHKRGSVGNLFLMVSTATAILFTVIFLLCCEAVPNLHFEGAPAWEAHHWRVLWRLGRMLRRGDVAVERLLGWV